MSVAITAFTHREVYIAILRNFPTSYFTQLRQVCRKMREIFPLSLFRARVKLPPHPTWQEGKLYKELNWFYMMPPFKNNYKDFPHFRVRSTMARLAQGALRMLHFERARDGDYLVSEFRVVL